jgi:hypothetical protein
MGMGGGYGGGYDQGYDHGYGGGGWGPRWLPWNRNRRGYGPPGAGYGDYNNNNPYGNGGNANGNYYPRRRGNCLPCCRCCMCCAAPGDGGKGSSWLVCAYVVYVLVLTLMVFSSSGFVMDSGESRIIPMNGFIHSSVSITDYSASVNMFHTTRRPVLRDATAASTVKDSEVSGGRDRKSVTHTNGPDYLITSTTAQLKHELNTSPNPNLVTGDDSGT